MELLIYVFNDINNGFKFHTHAGGLVGIAYIYNRMHNYTDRIEFKDAAIYWFEKTLQMAKFDGGLAGFKAWRAMEYGGSQNEFGFLEGIADIGLSFINAISDIEPK